ncbi:hypothetical protein [Shinella sp. M31]|uniref:hypothetical protein n=1 Tax=Shinella sp. M31 TaxID=3368615 RepID=UPI003BA2AC39
MRKKVEALADMIVALHAGADGDALADARRVAGAMDNRPWEQLPARLKSAIRTDIKRLIDSGADAAALSAVGYASRIVYHARRDLGLVG